MEVEEIDEVGYKAAIFMQRQILLGRMIEISMPNGEKRRAQFAIVEADNIIASHNENSFSSSKYYPTINGQNINDRNYQDDTNAQQKVIEVAQNLNPSILITTSRTPSGTPIITTDGIVVSGNNRTMSIKLAIKQYPDQYEKYLQFLKEEAFAFGFSDIIGSALLMGDPIALPGSSFHNPKTVKFDHPILVRIDYDFPEYNTTELSKYNKETKKSERPIDKAVKMGRILSESSNCKQVISDLVGQYETFTQFYANRNDQVKLRDALINCDIITKNEINAIFDESGFNDSGKDLIENLLAGLILKKDALVSAGQEGMKQFRGMVITSLPVLAKNIGLGAESLIDDLNKAFLLEKSIRSSGLSFHDFITQQNMFGEKPEYKAAVINRLMHQGRNAFKQAFENYNQAVIENQGESLFGDKPTIEEIFVTYIAKYVTNIDLELIKKSLLTNTVSPMETQVEETVTTKQPVKTDINLLIGDNFFKKNPDNVLGTAYEASGRFGKVTKYKGDIDSVNRIDAPLDFIGLNTASAPNTSYESETIQQLMQDPTALQNIEKSIALSKEEKTINEQKQKSTKNRKIAANQAQSDADMFSFQQVYQENNPEISRNELQVYLWYQWKSGMPFSEKWYKLAEFNPATVKDQTIIDWVNRGLLYYFRGNLYPAYVYLSGRIWEKKSAVENDKEQIVALYGDDVFTKQLAALDNVFKISYDKRLTLTNANFDNRLKIIPISKFANTYMIATLNDEKPFKAKSQPAGGKQPGRPDFLYTGHISDYKKTVFEQLSLTEAFCYWLVNYKGEYEIKRDVSYADIISIYIFQKNRPGIKADATNAEKKAAEAIWQRMVNLTKIEGDRLFSLFLSDWITANDIVTIETKWNEQFNGYLPVNYNKIPVAFSHATEYRGQIVDIRPEKREAVAFMMDSGAGVTLAYDVGVGKTWSALFTIKHFMEAGYCKRPFLVVPNQTYKQWLAEGRGLLPDVKFNDLYNLSKDYLDELRGPDGQIEMVPEFSISVMTYEGFEQIGFNEQTENQILNEMFEILDQQEPGIERKEKQTAALFERLRLLIGRGLRGTLINIEDLGFDFFCADEAHKMKKVFTGVKGEQKAGGDREKSPYSIQAGGEPSSIALKGFMISQYVLKNNNYRNVLLLTATPFTNSPLEIFSMLAFVGYHELRQNGINNLKSFFDTFVNASNELTINAKLKPERKQVVLGFNNLRALQQIIRRFINYKTGEMVRVKRPNKYVLPLRSKVINGETIVLSKNEQIDSSLPLSELQETLMADIKQYAEGKIALTAMCTPTISDIVNKVAGSDEDMVDATMGVELDEDTLSNDEKAGVRILRAMNYARNLALSPYLYECSGLRKPTYKQYIETSPKLQYTMECIRSVKEWHEKTKTPISGQVIYMDRGIEYFNLIKEYLVKEIGFKEHEVGIITSQMAGGKDAKEKVKMKFLGEAYDEKTGEVVDIPDSERMKIVIGSSTIKEGINLQKHSTVLYDCWPDWNPTDKKQLEGRIWRQGNLFKNVRIVTGLMIDSMDIFIFQKLEEKTKRIAEIWDTDGETNTFNLEEFNPSEIKSSLISDPLVLAEMETLENKEQINDDIRGIKSEMQRIDKILEAKDIFDSHLEDFREFVSTYRPSTATNEEGAIIDKRTFETLQSAMMDFLSTNTDAEGLEMVYNYEKEPGKKYSEFTPPHKPYYYDKLNLANRVLKTSEKDYLIPKGLKIVTLDAYKKSLQQKVTELEEVQKNTTSEEAIKIRAQIILEERAENKVEKKTAKQRAKEFATLNYLLEDRQQIKEKTVATSTSSCPPLDKDGKRRIDKAAIEELSACVAAQDQTKILYVDKDGNYTDARKTLHKKIIDDLLKTAVCIKQDKPIAILTGGAPGSGKTHFLKTFAPYLLSKELFHIDADEIRAQLPEYQGWNAAITHLETKDIVDELIENIGGPCKYDVVYDGTMNKARKYFNLIKSLKSAGYQVYIIYIDVPKEISYQRVMERYQRTGRFVPLDVVQEVYDTGHEAFNQIKKMVSGWILVDGVNGTVVERGGESIPTNRDYLNLQQAKKLLNGDSDKKPSKPEPDKAKKIKIAKAKAAAQAQRIRILKLK